MHAFPVTGLLAEFEVFGEQRADVAVWRRRGRRGALERRGRGRVRIGVRRKIHTTSMNSTQLQGEVSRKTRTSSPNSYRQAGGSGAKRSAAAPDPAGMSAFPGL